MEKIECMCGNTKNFKKLSVDEKIIRFECKDCGNIQTQLIKK